MKHAPEIKYNTINKHTHAKHNAIKTNTLWTCLYIYLIKYNIVKNNEPKWNIVKHKNEE